MMHLPIRKDYCGEPVHHPSVSNLVAQFIKMGYTYTIQRPVITVKINPIISYITVYPFTLTREPVNRYRTIAVAQKNEKNSATAGGTGGCGPLVDQRAASARRPLINSPGAMVAP